MVLEMFVKYRTMISKHQNISFTGLNNLYSHSEKWMREIQTTTTECIYHSTLMKCIWNESWNNTHTPRKIIKAINHQQMIAILWIILWLLQIIQISLCVVLFSDLLNQLGQHNLMMKAVLVQWFSSYEASSWQKRRQVIIKSVAWPTNPQ